MQSLCSTPPFENGLPKTEAQISTARPVASRRQHDMTSTAGSMVPPSLTMVLLSPVHSRAQVYWVAVKDSKLNCDDMDTYSKSYGITIMVA